MSELGEYVPERGYWLGDDLAPDESPWPLLWESKPWIDDHGHTWERVVIHRRGTKPEPVVRCINCHVPRCGDSNEKNPCMERRHHRTVHIRLDGRFDPVGGYLKEADRD
jgi:hypothetical protein